jgi:hypothetical protein
VFVHSNIVSAYTNPTASAPTLFQSWVSTTPVHTAVTLDFDRDGLDDLALLGNDLRLLRNTGAGFAQSSLFNIGGDTMYVADAAATGPSASPIASAPSPASAAARSASSGWAPSAWSSSSA